MTVRAGGLADVLLQLEKAKEQERLLEESARELAERQHQQEKLQRQLQEKAVTCCS